MENNEKQVILITGATKGLGLADAVRLAKDENNIVIANSHRQLNEEELKAFQANFDSEIDVLVGDVASEDDAKAMIDSVIENTAN